MEDATDNQPPEDRGSAATHLLGVRLPSPAMSPELAGFLWNHGCYSWGMNVVRQHPGRAWFGYFDGRKIYLRGR